MRRPTLCTNGKFSCCHHFMSQHFQKTPSPAHVAGRGMRVRRHAHRRLRSEASGARARPPCAQNACSRRSDLLVAYMKTMRTTIATFTPCKNLASQGLPTNVYSRGSSPVDRRPDSRSTSHGSDLLPSNLCPPSKTCARTAFGQPAAV